MPNESSLLRETSKATIVEYAVTNYTIYRLYSERSKEVRHLRGLRIPYIAIYKVKKGRN